MTSLNDSLLINRLKTDNVENCSLDCYAYSNELHSHITLYGIMTDENYTMFMNLFDGLELQFENGQLFTRYDNDTSFLYRFSDEKNNIYYSLFCSHKNTFSFYVETYYD